MAVQVVLVTPLPHHMLIFRDPVVVVVVVERVPPILQAAVVAERQEQLREVGRVELRFIKNTTVSRVAIMVVALR